jgi:hypothetical protein
VELRVDRIGAGLPRVPISPDRPEAVGVLAAAERTRPVPGRHRRRLVEEEELRELARLQERRAMPVLEAEAARDPALPGVPPPDAPRVVVKTAAVAVDEAAVRRRDELAEGRDAVLPRTFDAEG